MRQHKIYDPTRHTPGREYVPTRVEDIRPGDHVWTSTGLGATVTGKPRLVGVGTLIAFPIEAGGHPGEWLQHSGDVLDVAPVKPGPYALVIDGMVQVTGTLVGMMREAYGCGNAKVYRRDADGRLIAVVSQAGSASAFTYHRRIIGQYLNQTAYRVMNRRPARWARNAVA